MMRETLEEFSTGQNKKFFFFDNREKMLERWPRIIDFVSSVLRVLLNVAD